MLGNSRFLIIFISVLSAVALICLGASAVERVSPDDISRDGGFRVAPADFQLPHYAFSTITVLGSVNDASAPWGRDLVSAYGSSNPLSVTYFSVQTQNTSGVWQSAFTREFAEPVDVYFADNNGWLAIYVNGSRINTDGSFTNARCRCCFYNSVEPFPDDVNYPYLSFYTVKGTFNFEDLFNSILSVGNKLVSFVMSSWVVLVPVVAFVCILGFGVIRRLVKGV